MKKLNILTAIVITTTIEIATSRAFRLAQCTTLRQAQCNTSVAAFFKKKLIVFNSLMLLSIITFAQAPQAMNYQAIARDAAGVLHANQNISLRITITDGSGGTNLYQETHNTTTNQFGLFTLSVGLGTPVTGSFATISWGTVNAWMAVEYDPAGGTNYTLMGQSQLLSVPYALYAADGNPGPQGDPGPQGIQGPPGQDANLNGTTNYVVKFTPNGTTGGNSQIFDNANNIGINTTSPAGKLHIKGDTDTSQLVVDAHSTQSITNPLIRLRKSTLMILQIYSLASILVNQIPT